MWWIFSYTLANWPLILCVGAIVAALIAVTVFMRNWKAAVAAAVILAAGFAYQWIDKQGYQRAQAEERQRIIEAKNREIAALELRVATVNAANEIDGRQAVEDAARIADLERQSRETPANANVCLDRAAARRVRNIEWERAAPAPAKGGAAAGARGHSKVLPIWQWGRGS